VAYTAQEEEQSLLLVEIYSVKGSVGGKYGGALIPSCVAEVGSGCGHRTEVAGAHVLDPISVGITDAAPTGKAVVGGHKETIADKSCGGQELMHLVEQKVYAALSEEGDIDARWWVPDTGASNHMTGSEAAFASIDARMTGIVRLGDGSVVWIERRATIMYQCRNGEHQALPNVYYISMARDQHYQHWSVG
jgi:hypothetical protein